jgi:hypothetical protein
MKEVKVVFDFDFRGHPKSGSTIMSREYNGKRDPLEYELLMKALEVEYNKVMELLKEEATKQKKCKKQRN